ncbi:MAG TPA: ABC transporter permease subunit [Actinospica sp.]|nr:ABC transporter permease subunit [Actinospica sp.]
MTDVLRRLGGLAGVLILLLAWTVVAVFGLGTHGAVPTPWAVAHQMARDGAGLYWSNAVVTITYAAQGFLWGNLAALAVAAVTLLVPRLAPAASQLAVISYCMPLTAVGPIVLVVMGGRAPTVFLAAMAVFFTTLVGALLGVRSADPAALDVVRAYGGNRWHRLAKVQVIAALPAIINALKIAAPSAMLGAILGEYLGGVDSGLGVVLTLAQQQFDVPRTWALALVTGLLAFAGYGLFALLGRLTAGWSS